MTRGILNTIYTAPHNFIILDMQVNLATYKLLVLETCNLSVLKLI